MTKDTLDGLPGEDFAGPLRRRFLDSEPLVGLLDLSFPVGGDKVLLEDEEDALLLSFFVKDLALLLRMLVIDHALQLQMLHVDFFLWTGVYRRRGLWTQSGWCETICQQVTLAEELLMFPEEVSVELFFIVLTLVLSLLHFLISLLFDLFPALLRQFYDQGLIRRLLSTAFDLVLDELTFHFVGSFVAALLRVGSHDDVLDLLKVLLLIALGHVGSLIVR